MLFLSLAFMLLFVEKMSSNANELYAQAWQVTVTGHSDSGTTDRYIYLCLDRIESLFFISRKLSIFRPVPIPIPYAGAGMRASPYR